MTPRTATRLCNAMSLFRFLNSADVCLNTHRNRVFGCLLRDEDSGVATMCGGLQCILNARATRQAMIAQPNAPPRITQANMPGRKPLAIGRRPRLMYVRHASRGQALPATANHARRWLSLRPRHQTQHSRLPRVGGLSDKGHTLGCGGEIMTLRTCSGWTPRGVHGAISLWFVVARS